MILNSHSWDLRNIFRYGNSLSTGNPWKDAVIILGSHGNSEVLRKAIHTFPRAVQINTALYIQFQGSGLQVPEQDLHL